MCGWMYFLGLIMRIDNCIFGWMVGCLGGKLDGGYHWYIIGSENILCDV